MSDSEETIWDPISSLGLVMPPEWHRARFLPVVFLANEEELTGKTLTTSLNNTNPNTYIKFIFLRTSPLSCAFSSSKKGKSSLHLFDHEPGSIMQNTFLLRHVALHQDCKMSYRNGHSSAMEAEREQASLAFQTLVTNGKLQQETSNWVIHW